jgi:hypothetical protein
MAGYEAYQSDLSNLHGEAQGFQVITYNLGMTTNPSTYKASGGEFPQTRLLSQFGRINYTYAGQIPVHRHTSAATVPTASVQPTNGECSPRSR